MTDLTTSGDGAFSATVSSTGPGFFTVVLLGTIGVGVLTFIYHLSNSSLFNTISNAMCIVLILYAAYMIVRVASTWTASLTYIVLATSFTLLSIIANSPNASITDAIKYLSIYVFYAAGYACASRLRSSEFWMICILALLPLVFLATARESRVPDFLAANPGLTFAYLPNVNVASLYYAALIFTLAPSLGGYALLLQFVNIIMMNKIGPVVATTIALGTWIMFPLRAQSILALVLSVLLLMVAFWAGALDRPIAVLESMQILVRLGPEYVSRMSFGRLVEVTGTTDLSGFFRIVHWTNIWELYSGSGLGTLLFGYGIGQTVNVAVIPLIPHNDYLRVLVEYGAVNFAVFACFLLHVLLALKSASSRVLFIILLVYFCSENLVDHFASMTLYFAYAGRDAAMSRG